MPQFLGIHDLGAPTDNATVEDGWSKYKKACSNHECRPLHVHYNVDAGRAFCVTEAESADQVQAAHDEAEVPLKEVLEVKFAE